MFVNDYIARLERQDKRTQSPEYAENLFKNHAVYRPPSRQYIVGKPYSKLRDAVVNKDIEGVQRSLQRVSADNIILSEGSFTTITPLYTAIMMRDCPAEIVKLLLEANASIHPQSFVIPNIKTEKLSSSIFSPLQLCASVEFIELILKHKPNVIYCPYMCFIEAVAAGYDDIALYWIDFLTKNLEKASKFKLYFTEKQNSPDTDLSMMNTNVFIKFYPLIQLLKLEDLVLNYYLKFQRFELVNIIFCGFKRTDASNLDFKVIFENIILETREDSLITLVEYLLGENCTVTLDALIKSITSQSIRGFKLLYKNFTNPDILKNHNEFWKLSLRFLPDELEELLDTLNPNLDGHTIDTKLIGRYSVPTVKKLLNLGASLPNDLTSISIKSSPNTMELIKVLLQYTNKFPCEILLAHTKPEVVDLLIEAKCDLTPIVSSLNSFVNYPETLEKLLNLECIDTKSIVISNNNSVRSVTPVHKACFQYFIDSDIKPLEILLNHGWDVNDYCCLMNPLSHALSENNAELFRILLEHNADPYCCIERRLYPRQYDIKIWKDIVNLSKYVEKPDSPVLENVFQGLGFHRLFTRSLTSPRKEILFSLMLQLPIDVIQKEHREKNAFEISLDQFPKSGNKSYSKSASDLLGELLLKMNIDKEYALQRLQQLEQELHPNFTVAKTISEIVVGIEQRKRKSKSARFIVEPVAKKAKYE